MNDTETVIVDQFGSGATLAFGLYGIPEGVT